MHDKEVLSILSLHVPANAIGYSFDLWAQTPFELKLSRKRESKVGDFTYRNHSRTQRITLNHDLNQYLFLITYIHEVAHLRVHLHYGNKLEPHGLEWKKVFQNLMEPMLKESVFPHEILHLLIAHMRNPKASSFADRELTVRLRGYDGVDSQRPMLSELPEGSIFRLQGKYFKKGKLRRTRVLCHELKSKRQYLIPAEATVSDVQLSLL
ncbi:MAG TPA: SprT-like domain-containing protein [Cyclobacteriaceae bacterium]|nr:SprT-like domain-containing protein [Cyclobacteriaceae bacterium]